MAKLAHPNVVSVFDVGEHGGRVFFVMELVQGETIAAWCRDPRGVFEIVSVFRDIAHGLAAMHAAELVHRDVKPSNILVDRDGRGRIADLGLAHGAGEAARGGEPGLEGTPSYMAPEQLRGDPTDARSDQFGLCVSLFEALHGERPFPDGTCAERLVAIARGPRAPVRVIPAWLGAVLTRGLMFDPAARFPDLLALVGALAPPRRGDRHARGSGRAPGRGCAARGSSLGDGIIRGAGAGCRRSRAG